MFSHAEIFVTALTTKPLRLLACTLQANHETRNTVALKSDNAMGC